jgi:hypothetical protein
VEASNFLEPEQTCSVLFGLIAEDLQIKLWHLKGNVEIKEPIDQEACSITSNSLVSSASRNYLSMYYVRAGLCGASHPFFGFRLGCTYLSSLIS